MNWTFVLIGFALAVFMGSALVSLLATIRPEWSPRRRRLIAASVLAVITLIATLLMMLFVATANHGESQHTEDLALAALVTIGGGLTLLAWVGGLVGATLTSRRHGG
jgi:heme/copper-type cytochrome/quinol oxidase subunit 4